MTDTMSQQAIPLRPGDPLWPSRLNELGDATVLWAKGDLGLLAGLENSIAVVGARAMTAYGQACARLITQGLAAHDGRPLIVVSGGAYGIDSEALRAAMGVGGQVIVVSPAGIDTVYPAGSRALFDSANLVVSEYAGQTMPSRATFLARNRIIAALSNGMVVVEASRRSGTLAAAHAALRLGRLVMAVPGPVTSLTSTGCHDLLRHSPQVRLVTSADDVRQHLDTKAIGELLRGDCWSEDSSGLSE